MTTAWRWARAGTVALKDLNADDQNFSGAQMRSISAKTMVIVGDADGVKSEHALAMFRLRGGGAAFAVMPPHPWDRRADEVDSALGVDITLEALHS